jgi:hypothetical protein
MRNLSIKPSNVYFTFSAAGNDEKRVNCTAEKSDRFSKRNTTIYSIDSSNARLFYCLSPFYNYVLE